MHACSFVVAFVTGVALCSGCGVTAIDDDGDAASSLPHDLSAIVVEPTNQIVEVDLYTASSVVYTASGHFLDGRAEDLTARVSWTSDNPALGTFDGSTLRIPRQMTSGAQVTHITASLGDLRGPAQLTVVAYRMGGDATDFFFILPYQDQAGNQKKPLEFHTNVKALDVFFAMDTTGSMTGAITNLQSGVSFIIGQMRSEIPDAWFGAGSYEDFPVDPYGDPDPGTSGCTGLDEPDQPFQLFQAVTEDISLVQSAVDRCSTSFGEPIGCGGDGPEAMIEALYQIATGNGLSSPSPTHVAPNHEGVGGVRFRHGSMPVVVPITDAMSHEPEESAICPDGETGYKYEVDAVAHSRQATKSALAAICGKVVGVASPGYADGDCTAESDEADFARATGALVPPAAWDGARPAGCGSGQCCTDLNGEGRAPDLDGLCPLVFFVSSDGTGLGTSIITGLKMLTRYATFDVTYEMEGAMTGIGGEPLPQGATTADFIKMIETDSYEMPPPPPVLPDPTMDATSFHGVTPGTIVRFEVTAFNEFVPSTDRAQIFRAVIKVLGGGCTDLDEREVFILVPPTPIVVE
jgi:hypothetical protein